MEGGREGKDRFCLIPPPSSGLELEGYTIYYIRKVSFIFETCKLNVILVCKFSFPFCHLFYGFTFGIYAQSSFGKFIQFTQKVF